MAPAAGGGAGGLALPLEIPVAFDAMFVHDLLLPQLPFGDQRLDGTPLLREEIVADFAFLVRGFLVDPVSEGDVAAFAAFQDHFFGAHVLGGCGG